MKCQCRYTLSGGCLSSYRGEFTEDLKPENLVDFQRFFVNIAGEKHNVSLKYVSRFFLVL